MGSAHEKFGVWTGPKVLLGFIAREEVAMHATQPNTSNVFNHAPWLHKCKMVGKLTSST